MYENAQHTGRGERGFVGNHLAKRTALEELHDHIEVAERGLPEVVKANRIGVGEARAGASLAVKSVDAILALRCACMHHLDGDDAVDGELFGTEDNAHPPLSDHFENLVPAAKRAPNPTIVLPLQLATKTIVAWLWGGQAMHTFQAPIALALCYGVNMRLLPKRVGFLAVACVVLSVGCSKNKMAGSVDGAKGYADACARCHGADGVPTPGMRSRTGVKPLNSDRVKGMSDDEILKQIRNGSKNRMMPAFQGAMSDAQLEAIVAHIRTLQAATP